MNDFQTRDCGYLPKPAKTCTATHPCDRCLEIERLRDGCVEIDRLREDLSKMTRLASLGTPIVLHEILAGDEEDKSVQACAERADDSFLQQDEAEEESLSIIIHESPRSTTVDVDRQWLRAILDACSGLDVSPSRFLLAVTADVNARRAGSGASGSGAAT